MNAPQNVDLTSSFMAQLSENAAMKVRIDNLERNEGEINSRILAAVTALTVETRSLRESIGAVPRLIAECRNDMRHEFDRDFSNKLEASHMERRIEDSIADTDKTLGKQIAAIDTKLTDQISSVKSDVAGLKNTVARQWLKITVIVSTISAVALTIQWFLYVYQVVRAT